MQYGGSVLFCKAAQVTAGSYGAVVFVGTGTSVITMESVSPLPFDAYEAVLKVLTGGTIGVAGITFRYSLDGERTYSAATALGTANTYTVPNSGVKFKFAAGTLVAADTATVTSVAPTWDAASLTTALNALSASNVDWNMSLITGPMSAADAATVESLFVGYAANHRWRWFTANTRVPNAGESDATYVAAMATAFANTALTHGDIVGGTAKWVSGVSGRQYRWPAAYPVAARDNFISIGASADDPSAGALAGVLITDANGNLTDHDESITPGLDDGRITSLRRWDRKQGVYITRARILSADGSDFRLTYHRKVMNLAEDVLYQYLLLQTNKNVRVDKTTGFLAKSARTSLQNGGLAVLVTALGNFVSDVQFTVAADDNVLSTQTIHCEARIIPFGQIEFITVTVAFYNPAIQALVA
jgi:aryl carrier-like protein